MPYITRSNEDKARQDAELEATAEANKREWLARARRGAAEEDARNEMIAEAQDEVNGSFPNDSKAAAEAMLRRRTSIDAQIVRWRDANEWPRTRAERMVRDEEVRVANEAARAKMESEAKANAAKAAKPDLVPAPKPFWPSPDAKASTIEADRKAEADAAAKLAADEKRV